MFGLITSKEKNEFKMYETKTVKKKKSWNLNLKTKREHNKNI